jgi:hypothetical protein
VFISLLVVETFSFVLFLLQEMILKNSAEVKIKFFMIT